MSGAPRRIVIVGRDAALWLAACALQRALAGAGVRVTAIELPTALGPASLYASLPALEALHAKLGLEEATLLRATRGGMLLGYNIVAPRGGLPPFFLAHGGYGAPIQSGAFFPYWAKARRFGMDAALEDFSLTAMAARQGRMLLPDEATEAFGRTDYGYHLPALAYAGLLKGLAQRLGVAVRQAQAIATEHDGDTIRAVITDGEPVTGDLFVDASGAEALLLGGALGVGREDWRAHFPADRRLIALAPPFTSIPPYAEWRAGPAGWLAMHATPGATHLALAYRAADLGDDDALAAAASLSGLTPTAVSVQAVAPGIRDAFWRGNCVAIGAAACAFDPLLDLDLHATQLGIVHLLSLFPAGANFAAERVEYDRILRSHLLRLRDFQIAFHALNRFAGEGFWAEARERALPDTVAHTIATFRARGEIAPMEDETFAPDQWQALFVGLGEMPESWLPAIDRTPPETMKQEFRRILGFIKDKVLEQPTHDAYLASIGRSAAA